MTKMVKKVTYETQADGSKIKVVRWIEVKVAKTVSENEFRDSFDAPSYRVRF